jgi:dTDP-4-dehydrorhamnose 3,5-epimerase
MQIEWFDIPGIFLLTPKRNGDQRGFLSETFRADFLAAHGVDSSFVQDNQVFSEHKGVLRGLHFQAPPHAQGKLVRCIRGAILDVAVDIRIGSPTYMRHVEVELSAVNWRQLWVPPGFAHGYLTLQDNSEVLYKVTDYYAPDCERGIAWDDPALAINWQLQAADVIVSEKDRRQPRLQDAESPFRFD